MMILISEGILQERLTYWGYRVETAEIGHDAQWRCYPVRPVARWQLRRTSAFPRRLSDKDPTRSYFTERSLVTQGFRTRAVTVLLNVARLTRKAVAASVTRYPQDDAERGSRLLGQASRGSVSSSFKRHPATATAIRATWGRTPVGSCVWPVHGGVSRL